MSDVSVFRNSLVEPFVIQEALMLLANNWNKPIVYGWVHPKALLLGARDLSLASSYLGIEHARVQGFWVAVRPFGGLAVPVDEGVLNITLILPGELPLDACFAQLTNLLVHACKPYGDIAVGEVSGSYCPGRYDLSVHGVKVAGVAQRRLAHVSAVSAFVNVSEAGVDRESVIQGYYERSIRDEVRGHSFIPKLKAGSVGNLTDASPYNASSEVERLYQAILESTSNLYPLTISSPLDVSSYIEAARERLIRKNPMQEWAPIHVSDN